MKCLISCKYETQKNCGVIIKMLFMNFQTFLKLLNNKKKYDKKRNVLNHFDELSEI